MALTNYRKYLLFPSSNPLRFNKTPKNNNIGINFIIIIIFLLSPIYMQLRTDPRANQLLM